MKDTIKWRIIYTLGAIDILIQLIIFIIGIYHWPWLTILAALEYGGMIYYIYQGENLGIQIFNICIVFTAAMILLTLYK